MVRFVVQRIVIMVINLFLISIISFTIIQLPPGDFLTSYLAAQTHFGAGDLPPETIQALRSNYGLDQPMYVQYLRWIEGFPRGDFGVSFVYTMGGPVMDIIRLRIGNTFLLVLSTLVVSWALAIPLGIYAATHKNRIGDYVLSFISFLGLSVPNFVLAIFALWISVFVLNSNYTGGFYSGGYADAPWTWDKLMNLLSHVWIPVALLTFSSMAGTFRIMRGNLLDVLDQQFVETARSKGLKERVVVYRHAARLAINPLISRFGMHLPVLFEHSIILSIVLSLPTLGPAFYQGLLGRDMYLAGTILLIFGVVLLIGNFIADVLLAWSDPRIRYA